MPTPTADLLRRAALFVELAANGCNLADRPSIQEQAKRLLSELADYRRTQLVDRRQPHRERRSRFMQQRTRKPRRQRTRRQHLP